MSDIHVEKFARVRALAIWNLWCARGKTQIAALFANFTKMESLECSKTLSGNLYYSVIGHLLWFFCISNIACNLIWK